VFLINVPMGLLSLFLVGTLVSEPSGAEQERRQLLSNGLRVDYVGFALVAVGLGSLEFVLDEGQSQRLVRIERDRGFRPHRMLLPGRGGDLGIEPRRADYRHPLAGTTAVRRLLPGDAWHRRNRHRDHADPGRSFCRPKWATQPPLPDWRCRRADS
jgi:hypothetical protein